MAQAHALRIGHGAQTRENNKVRAEDYSVHGWYRFILSYPHIWCAITQSASESDEAK